MSVKKDIFKESGPLLPTEEIFNSWHEMICYSSGIKFSLDVLKAAYFMDIGYRGGMNKFSEHSFPEAKEEPWKIAIGSYRLKDGNWNEDMDTDTIGSLLNKCCLIQFGMEHPCYGDTTEYKKRFDEVSKNYINENK